MMLLDRGAPAGHLGTAWEIALVIIFVTLACIVIGTVAWQRRRRRRRQMRREMLAVEEGRLPSLELPPDGTRLALAGEANSRPFDEGSQPVTKPRPTASPYRHSKELSSSPTDHRSAQPRRYYWDG